MSSDRDLRTSISQVFGHVEKGTTCRICGRDVDDGRAVYCSDYCRNLAKGVMSLLNWSGVRRLILTRDDHTCQSCGFDFSWIRTANDHIQDRIESELPEKPTGPTLENIDDYDDDDWLDYWDRKEAWDEQRAELIQKYGDPHRWDRELEVDHITPISEGGHPFDPANLQTLCDECHQEKTSREASEPATPSRLGVQETLFEYASDGGEP